jgi:ABC-type polysaccharide/polyol phosphate export permease
MVLFIFIPIFPHSFKLSWALLLIPVVLGFLVLCLAGVALAMSVLNVIYRDLAYLVEIGLMILYWLTPIIYRIEAVPEPYQKIFKCSPLAGVVNALRNIIMLGQPPSLLGWASIILPSVLIFGIGWLIFRRWERTVLDYV